MALVNKRITELPERSALNPDDYTVVDGDTGGTAKYNLANMDEDVSNLKTIINDMPDIKEPEEVDADLYICDSNGNVIGMFADGHFATKEFDSKDVAEVSIPSDNSDVDISDTYGNVIVRFEGGHIKTKNFDSSTIDDMLPLPETDGVSGQVLGLNNDLDVYWRDIKSPIDTFIDNVDIDYRFDAQSNANFIVIRVYKDTIQGGKQYPFVFAPNGAQPSSGSNKSTYEMTTEYGFVLAINAGVFDTSNGYADGILVMNGVSFQNSPTTTHQECRPLWIDSNGDLHSADYDASTADLIAQGCVSAVCGFMPIIVDYEPVPSSEWNSVSHYTDNAQRQIIGQFGNGDYAIVTCEGRNYQNSDGWTIAEAQAICQEIGLKFAYNLDGGGSTETMIGLKHINTIYDGTYGRKVPTFIVFNGTTAPPNNPTV